MIVNQILKQIQSQVRLGGNQFSKVIGKGGSMHRELLRFWLEFRCDLLIRKAAENWCCKFDPLVHLP